jgi:Mn2+/Fe2+ NRAMP family transporter
LLFGIPLIGGALIAALHAFPLLLLMNRGFRFLEGFVIALLIVIAVCFAIQVVAAAPRARAGSVCTTHAPVVDQQDGNRAPRRWPPKLLATSTHQGAKPAAHRPRAA